MDKELLEKYKGRKLKIQLKDGFFYTCHITYILERSIEIKDKFGNILFIDLDHIAKVEVSE